MKAISFNVVILTGFLWLSACSQQGGQVRVYHYGENKQSSTGSLGLHTYRSGETLWSIANAYQVDLRNLLDANGMVAPYRIHSGDRILIPAPTVYKIQRGDTLYKVSRMFDETTTDIARLNNLRPPYALAVNQSLRIPVQRASSGRLIKSAPLIRDPEIVRSQQPAIIQPQYDTRNPHIQPSGQHNNKAKAVAAIQREELAPPSYASPIPTKKGSAENIQSASLSNPPEDAPQYVDHTPLVLSQKGFMKPVPGKIISAYGRTAEGLHNDGINIKAARGDAVRSAEQGVVVYSGSQIEGYGNMLLVRHADGFMTAYAHMDKILVKKGDRVKKGQSIGTVGTTGHVNTPQLHFEIRKGREAVNPALYLKA